MEETTFLELFRSKLLVCRLVMFQTIFAKLETGE